MDAEAKRTPRPLTINGIRHPKRTKFAFESEFFIITDTTEPSNVPRLAEPSADA